MRGLLAQFVIALSVMVLNTAPCFAYNDSRSGPLMSPDISAIREKCADGQVDDWLARCAPNLPDETASAQEREAAHIQRLQYFMQMDEKSAEWERDALLAGQPTAQALHAVARYDLTMLTVKGAADKLETAKRYLDEAGRLAPETPAIMASEAWIVEWEGNTRAAADLYQQVLKIEPTNTLANKQLGSMYYSAGDFKNALASFSVAITQLPEKDLIRCQRAEVYVALERFKPARDDYELCLANFPGNPMAQLAFAKTQAQVGDFKGATLTYDTLINDPRMAILKVKFGAEIYLARGVLHIGLGNSDKARTDFSDAVKLGNTRILLQLQLFLRKNGVNTPITGVTDQALLEAVNDCLSNGVCKLKLLARSNSTP
jgi:tetratricopeptide (TPR) repeat protein